MQRFFGDEQIEERSLDFSDEIVSPTMGERRAAIQQFDNCLAKFSAEKS